MKPRRPPTVADGQGRMAPACELLLAGATQRRLPLRGSWPARTAGLEEACAFDAVRYDGITYHIGKVVQAEPDTIVWLDEQEVHGPGLWLELWAAASTADTVSDVTRAPDAGAGEADHLFVVEWR